MLCGVLVANENYIHQIRMNLEQKILYYILLDGDGNAIVAGGNTADTDGCNSATRSSGIAPATVRRKIVSV